MIFRDRLLRILLPFLALLGFAATAAAADKELELPTFMSHYVWRGVQLSAGPVCQSSVTIPLKGFSANLWGNYDFRQGSVSEADLTFSYGKEMKKLSLEAGVTHYALIGAHDSDEIYAAISAGWPLQPSFKAYVDVNAGKGAFLQPSIGHSLALSRHATLDLELSVGIMIRNGFIGVTDAGTEYSGLHNAELTADCPLKLSRRWTLTVRAGATTPLSRNARQAIRNSSILSPGQSSFNGTVVCGGATLTLSF